MYNKDIINDALDYTRDAVTQKIRETITQKKNITGAYQPLYELLADYPFRKGKTLRPALCISVARAAGGLGHSALVSSTALELYHNAFLIHDDIEDGSENRRGKQTLHKLIGVPRAVNIGDATNVLAVSLLLENLNTVGVAKTLHIIHEIENMARQSVEGQSMELDWVAANTFGLTDKDYVTMCTKKTCWYTFIAPCRIGYIAGNYLWKEEDIVEHLGKLTEFGMMLGIAFQIQDDLLNLLGKEDQYGKEIGGDIFEGKRTIMLNHVLSHAGKARKKMHDILKLARRHKKQSEVDFILNEMHKRGSLTYGQLLAQQYAAKAKTLLDGMTFLEPSSGIKPGEIWGSEVVDYRFLRELVNYVIERNL
jgi:geranylgeranyl diphosphate synthase type II